MFLGAYALCAIASLAQPDTQDSDRERLETVALELIQLKLSIARGENDAETELKLIRDEALRSDLSKVALFGLEEAAKFSPERFGDVAEPVAALAHKGTPELAARAVEVLYKYTTLIEVQTAIQDASRHPDPGVRRRVATALRTIKTEAALAVLIILLKDPVVEVRLAAVEATSEHGGAAGQALFDRFQTESDPNVLKELISGLGTLRHAGALDRLISHLRHTNENIVWEAINALGKIGDPAAYERLNPFLEPEQPEQLRLVAIKAIGRLRLKQGQDRLVALMATDENPKVRHDSATALGSTGATELATGALLAALRSERDETVREAVWKSMLSLTEEKPDARVTLLGLLLEKNQTAEAAKLCGRLHARRLAAELEGLYRPLERSLADALFAARDLKESLVHYRHVALGAPPELVLVQRTLECFRSIPDLDGAVRFLVGEFKRATGDNADRWKIGDTLAGVIKEHGDAFGRTRVLYDLLNPNPAEPPEAFRKLWRAAYDRAAGKVRAAILSPDAKKRDQARLNTAALGRRIVLPLADWLEADAEPDEHSLFLMLGNAIAGTDHAESIATDPKQRAEAARGWRTWHGPR